MKNTSASHFFEKYVNEMKSLRQFLKLAQFGLDRATDHVESEKLIHKLLTRDSGISQAVLDPMLASEDIQAFAQKQKKDGFPYLQRLAVVRVWSILEAVVDESIAHILSQVPWSQLPAAAKAIKGPIVEFLEADEEARNDFLLDSLKQGVRASLKRGVGRFEALLEAVGFGGKVETLVGRTILELSEVRHAIVHRMGLADAKFISRCPWVTVLNKEPIPIEARHVRCYLAAANWYIFEILDRTLHIVDTANPQDPADLQPHHEKIRTHKATFLAELVKESYNTQLVDPPAEAKQK